MKFADALRLSIYHEKNIAWIGAGGKTTAMFRLGNELAPALVTTSTHLGAWQAAAVDRHLVWLEGEPMPDIGGGLSQGVTLITGGETDGNRLRGLSANQFADLHGLAEDHGIPLLVEADGARQRPLKAPAAHEPVIPPWVDLVVVTAGLSALGQPLTSEWVHRMERFSELANLDAGQIITPPALAAVLTHPEGGLQGIPSHTRRVVLLNQADTATRQSDGQTLAGLLIPTFHTVILAALAPAGMDMLPPSQTQVVNLPAVFEQTAGIVLAAGKAARFGRPKQLLTWKGEPFVRRAARTALDARLSTVIVVTGAYRDEVEPALADLPVQIAYNPDWATGQASSVRTGLQALPEGYGSAVFLLADQPQIPATLIRSLLAEHTHTLAPIVAPLIDGRRGNPVCFDRVTFPDLAALQGDTGGRVLFSRYPVTWLPWHDASALYDVDTIEDYHRLVENACPTV